MVIDSDAFLDMPQSAQNLYFHLNMRADDDGFIDNPKKIMRIIGAAQDDLRILFSKRYVLGFESGVLVIKHWKLHNCIQKDRYKPTVYKEEFEQLAIKENGVYTEHKSIEHKEIKACIQDVNSLDPECYIDKIRVDKISIDKIRINETINAEFELFWNVYPNKKGKKKALEAYTKLYKSHSLPDDLFDIVDQWSITDNWKNEGGKYIPFPATWLNGERWNDELPSSKSRLDKPAGKIDYAKGFEGVL